MSSGGSGGSESSGDGVDAKAVAAALLHTFNVEEGPRKAAEAALKKFESKAGFLACLLRITTVNDIPQDVRQASSIRLKNLVVEFWTIKKGELNKISEQDRKVVKDNILEAVVFQPLTILRSQLLETFFLIARHEFPNSWPDIIPAIMKNIQSGNKQRIYGGVCALRMLYKRFRFTDAKKRAPVDQMIVATYPVLGPLFASVVKTHTVDSFELCRQLIKIFFVTIELRLPPYLRNPSTFTPWLTLCVEVFETPLPSDQAAACKDAESLAKHPLWKCKKWTVLTFSRLFSRFGHPKVAEEEEKEFATFFYSKFAEPLMNSVMKMLKWKQSGGATTPRVLQICLNYISICVSYSNLWKKLKPHLNFLLLETALPALMLTQDDLTMWKDNPHEFVRRNLDIMEEFFIPRVAANNLLCETVKLRTKDSLQLVLNAVEKILTGYATAPSGSPQKNPLLKEGALRMVGGIKKYLLSKPERFGAAVESLLVTHVFPEFKSSVGYLRATACWIIGTYAKLKWSKPENQNTAVRLATTSLTDKELPVRLEAAIAVSRIVGLAGEEVVDFLRPHIKTILEQYFHLIDEIGNDEVIRTLSDFIHCVGKDVAPFALHIVQKMVNMFNEYMKADPEDDEPALAATQCLGTVNVILYALESLPEMYPAMEKIVAPLLDKLLCAEGIEYFEDILETIACLTWFPKTISEFQWSLLPRILKGLEDWAGDYIPNITPPLCNYIEKGTDRFLGMTSPNVFVGTLSLCKKYFDSTDAGLEDDCSHCTRIVETIIAFAHGKIDKIIPDILKMVSNKALNAHKIGLKLLSFDIIAELIHYNPLLFLNILKTVGDKFTRELFNHWLSSVDHMEKFKQRKLAVIGLASLCKVPLSQFPKELAAAFPKVLTAIMALLHEIQESKGDDNEDSEEDGEIEEFSNLDDDEDAKDELQSLTNYTKKIQKQMSGLHEGGLIADDDIQKPYESLDEFMYWAAAMQELNRLDPSFYGKYTASLSSDEKEGAKKFLETAKERQIKLQKKAQKAAASSSSTSSSSSSSSSSSRDDSMSS